MCAMLGSHSSSSAHLFKYYTRPAKGCVFIKGRTPKKIYISKYLSVGTDDNSRAEAKGAGSFVEGGQYSYSFPNTTSDTTHGWGI